MDEILEGPVDELDPGGGARRGEKLGWRRGQEPPLLAPLHLG